jgi:hypothetical protein
MSNAVRYLLAASLLFAVTGDGREREPTSLVELEKAGIDKIARLTAAETSTILFTLADYIVGYAKEGRVEWISATDNRNRPCGWPHPALSHDGLRVALVRSSDTPKRCRIMIHDIPTVTERQLAETSGEPGEISWSWDDGDISFFERGISAVSVRSGVKRMLLPFPMKVDDHQFTFSVWQPMQWLHNGRDLVVELETEIPTKEPGTHTYHGHLLLVSGGDAQVIDVGSRPAVSPVSDRIAYHTPGAIRAINADKTGRIALATAPRTLLLFSEALFGNIVWSSDGTRLFFGTIVSENRRDKLYLLDVKSGRRERFLSETSIGIRGWH